MFLFLIITPSYCDSVHFLGGNTLSGHVAMKGDALQIRLVSGGATIIDPAQISIIEYGFPVKEGDALESYLSLADSLDKNQDFIRLRESLRKLFSDHEQGVPEPDSDLREQINLFAGRNRDIFRQLVDISLLSQCDRAKYLLQNAPPDAILRGDSSGSFQVLFVIRDLYRVYVLTDPEFLLPDLEPQKTFTGLRIASHWKHSIAPEGSLALSDIAGLALDYEAMKEIPAVPDAWNRIQDFLRFIAFDKPVEPEQSVKLSFQLYERAFKFKEMNLPEQLNPDSADAWISLLAGEAEYAYRLAKQKDIEMAQDRRDEIANRLLTLLEPDWNLTQHPDYAIVRNQSSQFRSRLDDLFLQDCQVLQQSGYQPDSKKFNPLRLVPDSSKGRGPFGIK